MNSFDFLVSKEINLLFTNNKKYDVTRQSNSGNLIEASTHDFQSTLIEPIGTNIH